jgi:nucleoid-associated protein YejK
MQYCPYDLRAESTLTHCLNPQRPLRTFPITKGTQLTADDLLSKRNRAWNRFLSKDLKVSESFHDLYPSLLSKLATGIFVKESRLTWILEQKTRFNYTLASFDVSSPETIGDFLTRYNESIEELVLLSNYGFAAEIDQEGSALEKHEAQEHYNSSPGVQELKKLDKEHDNIINRLLAYLH